MKYCQNIKFTVPVIIIREEIFTGQIMLKCSILEHLVEVAILSSYIPILVDTITCKTSI